jgi:hypothetical protein
MSEYDALLRESDEIEGGVTAGPWEHDGDTDCNIIGHSYLRRGRHIDTMSHADAAFIARSRTLVPELAAALRASEAKREAVEKVRNACGPTNDGTDKDDCPTFRLIEELREMATRTAIPVYRIEALTLAAERLAGFEASWLAECEHETENIKLRAIADVAISRAEAAEKRERAWSTRPTKKRRTTSARSVSELA